MWASTSAAHAATPAAAAEVAARVGVAPSQRVGDGEDDAEDDDDKEVEEVEYVFATFESDDTTDGGASIAVEPVLQGEIGIEVSSAAAAAHPCDKRERITITLAPPHPIPPSRPLLAHAGIAHKIANLPHRRAAARGRLR